MSFKREGDNPNSLANLRKRRINELFAEDIPEDEAFLMRNGKLSCTVCNHRPVFDTINMLAIHRQGKKHLINLEFHVKKKLEFKQLVAKRKHEQFLKDGTTHINMPKKKSASLLGTCLYDSRSKREKSKPWDRKLRVCLGSEKTDEEPSATDKSSLPGFTKRLYESSSPVMHSRKLKDVFKTKELQSDTFPVQPYVKRELSNGLLSKQPNNYVKSMYKDSQAVNQQGSYINEQEWSSPNICMVPSLPQNGLSNSYNLTHQCATPTVSIATVIPPPPPPPEPVIKQKKKPKDRSDSVKETGSDCKSDRQLQKEKYLKLLESGWKRDRGGNWVRDEEVEFDSDEDTPSLQL